MEDENYVVPVSFQDQSYVRAFDADGDSYTDIVQGWWTGTEIVSKAYLNDKGDVDMLTGITTSKGAEITPSYKATTMYKDGSDNLLSVMPLVFDTIFLLALGYPLFSQLIVKSL